MLETQRAWFRKIGIGITNGYGMTENCAITTQLDAKIFNKPGSVGIPTTRSKYQNRSRKWRDLMQRTFVMKDTTSSELTDEVIKDGWFIQEIKAILMKTASYLSPVE